jgi:hypothetical protein
VNDRTKAIVAIVVGFFLVGLIAMLVVGLVSGDDVDREENPVIGMSHTAPAARALP